MKFSKGQVVHRTKSGANKVIRSLKQVGMKYRVVRLKGGYRVDKDWS
jgi:hypothetical protein